MSEKASTKIKAPLIGWMIFESATDDNSEWEGVITYPDPTGANIAWESPIKMIEHSAYEALQVELREANAATQTELDLREQQHLQNRELQREVERLRADNNWLRERLSAFQRVEGGK